MIRLLLLAYPAAWRRRYGSELEQLVADSGLSATAALDLLRAGFGERGRSLGNSLTGGAGMLVGPAHRHPTGLALIALAVLAPTLLFVTGSLLAYQLGIAALRGPLDAIAPWLGGPVALVLAVSPAVALFIATLPLVRVDLRRDGERMAIVGLRLRAANLAVASLALLVLISLAWYVLGESVIGPY